MPFSPDEVQLNFSDGSLTILNICLGFIMFGVALDLTPDDFKRLIRNPKASIVGILSQFLVLPFLTWLIIMIFKPHPSFAMGMILVAACPGGNTSNFMTHLGKGNSALSITLTAFATLAAIIMTPLNFSFWTGMVPELAELTKSFSLEPINMVKIILLIIVIPLILGMSTHVYLPYITDRIRKPVKTLSMLIFAGFVIVALKNNMHAFQHYAKFVILLVISHNAVALAAGYFIAKASRLGEYNARAISLETGLQNAGLGLILIFNFFDGMGGMALIAACWGVWHLLSGLALAMFWSSRPIDGASTK